MSKGKPLADSIRHFPDWIRNLREAAGMAQYELAELAGVSRTAINAYEAGHAEPCLSTFCSLALALKLEPSTLLRAILSPCSRVIFEAARRAVGKGTPK